MSQRVRTKLCFNRLLIPPHCQPEQSTWNLLETQGLSFQWKTTPSYEMWEGDTLSSPQPGEKGLRALLPGSKGACLLCLTAPCMRSSDRWHFAQVKVIGKTWRGSRAARLHLGHREGFWVFEFGSFAQWGPGLEPSFHYPGHSGSRGTTAEMVKCSVGAWRCVWWAPLGAELLPARGLALETASRMPHQESAFGPLTHQGRITAASVKIPSLPWVSASLAILSVTLNEQEWLI